MNAMIISLLLALAAILAKPSPAAAQFTLGSFNTLHLGQGGAAYQTNKEGILRTLFAGLDVVMLQEVMAQANLANVTPPGTHFFLATPVQGPTTYKEAYAFLVRNTLTAATPAVITGVGGYARPPAGVLINQNGTTTWVIDYHAVYGRSITARRNEVSRWPAVYQGFQALVVGGAQHPRAVMGGDWNLGATDPAFTGVNPGPFLVQPTTRTSLKRNGGLSQPYDHFLWDPTVVPVAAPQVVAPPNPPGTLLGWRQQISDHLGIAALVQ